MIFKTTRYFMVDFEIILRYLVQTRPKCEEMSFLFFFKKCIMLKGFTKIKIIIFFALYNDVIDTHLQNHINVCLTQ